MNDDELDVLRALRDEGGAAPWSSLRRLCSLDRRAMEHIARGLLARGLVVTTGEHDAMVMLTARGRGHVLG